MDRGSKFRGRGGMRGGARGRGRGGGRGRGDPRGRGGRGRGRGGIVRFDSSRLAAREDAAENESESAPPSEDETESDIEEEESESEKKKEAYRSLMESFESRSTAPSAKRRKLDHGDSTDQEENAAVVQSAATTSSNGDDDDDDDEEDDQSEEDDEGSSGDGDSDDGEGKDVDFVEEDEDAEDDLDEDDDDDDEQLDSADPFESHFSAPNVADVDRRMEAIQEDGWFSSKVTVKDSRQIFTIPQTNASNNTFSPPAPITAPQKLKLKKRLAEGLSELKKTEFNPVEQQVAPLLFNYYDTLFCDRTPDNGDDLRRLASLHAVNHVFKTRDRVLKNNEKLAKAARKLQENGSDEEDDDLADDQGLGDDGGEYRDQGFNRPKVLMLLPTRQSCARMVEAICAVCRPEQQENRKRFDDAYVDKSSTIPEDRPADFRDLFEGNDDDMFRLGLKFTRKTVKYFSQFYNSDIILASPLGLRMAMGSEDSLATSLSASKKKSKPTTDFDFLTSIEVVLLDQADALLMQNWEHVEHIFSHLNLLPRDSNYGDITRLRSWYLDEQAKYYRQTVVFSAFHTPALAELFRRFCNNWAGRARVQPGEYHGVVGRLGVRGVKQTFSRFESPTIEAEPDARFDYFVKAVVPALIAKSRSGSGSTAANRSSGVLVFIPSYLDFVRVRNWFATAVAVANVSFGAISEYASVSEASRAMSHFLTGRHRVLLYTERAHHFRRHQINGARTVIMYGLPENPTFYTEITGGYLGRSQRSQRLEPGQGAVRAMFSQYDAFKLERIVGSQRVAKMIRERSDTFVFEEEKAF